ncbi:hypothetical protein [Sandaracinobacteroides hominis]|uniref:hypothetical protein n=1 Tax=Sandaracinobacteroides hominis TaxID=2780086 RepID=UPI0018F2F2E1|nr:hypothetical protein [Sandaracinobacteroides hominis]
MADSVLVQIHLAGSASLAAAARKLGVPAAKLDADYGVVAVDLAASLYAVKLDKSEAGAAEKLGQGGAEGIFADPKIEPFGPPDS